MRQDEITEIVERSAKLVAEHYVFPDVAERIAAHLGDRLRAGRYADVADPAALGALVTEDLQSANRDLHLRLKHHVTALPERDEDPDEGAWADLAARHMGGVARVERLAGNVGLLDLRPFLLPPQLGGAAVTAALGLLAGTDALLLDLRGNLGGSPDMTALVCGWFFAEPVHLHTMYNRAGAGRQYWSAAHLPVPGYQPDKPVYVLTGPDTFSGGEELAYDLQQLGRATVVGERTRGGAHPRTGFRAHPHLELTVPVARPVHAATGTNWEGTGVAPDVETPAAGARDTAYRMALESLLAADPQRPTADEARAALAGLA
ncbi:MULTISPECIES: S41 family peptidase [Micromonospora]|uniref:Peptidase S41 n=1 Tax=Micromonospora solifontis TaxID=2487138 RepID=A0ABX9WFC6_9ACTN|nr:MULTISPECIES: S41 family peptidase [Micromonospora]NES16406.1 S41 family peptidase [Micromonospora sp. PPF5-17B]NES37241.1 S41 family peptidase [Micromonospora solifontis]NES57122.1 S41 family peptidase [Micromonospora sp. PPF5-6]RNL98590.1 peptidase S41 [Micromonospora solifontis]